MNTIILTDEGLQEQTIPSITHNSTTSRDVADCHPMTSITGLSEILDGLETLLEGI